MNIKGFLHGKQLQYTQWGKRIIAAYERGFFTESDTEDALNWRTCPSGYSSDKILKKYGDQFYTAILHNDVSESGVLLFAIRQRKAVLNPLSESVTVAAEIALSHCAYLENSWAKRVILAERRGRFEWADIHDAESTQRGLSSTFDVPKDSYDLPDDQEMRRLDDSFIAALKNHQFIAAALAIKSAATRSATIKETV